MNELEVRDINSYYGKSHILFGVSLDVAQGQVVGLIGRNGAGKSTTLKSIIGLVPPRQGSITYQGRNICGLPSHRIAKLGVGFVPEDRRVFSDLTVLDNLEIMKQVNPRGEGQWSVERIFDLFPKLAQLKDNRGMDLSGGEQQMVTIARTLMINPSVLLLDEPTEGLAPLIVREIKRLIQEVRKTTTILLAEQNLRFVLDLIDYGYVIDQGKVVLQGTAAELDADEHAKQKYLGV
ncbi:MAG: ABC transporter ATP-binding protein [Desulfarculaceae bacterium]|nr:ABC transporter ATP-binding protein [Desulfarculaceae bacterium]MCF8071171.1 ABC transporter ATP-binding protein [Desulfarculaceae bacterium]MCF8101226.1 ABC transporter ATP-binding protein [Desulfarculaceae bacterium]MCF8115225.1 ABC transporter ATP-binding protein [Desulfarculaceae bacterium]